MTTSSAIKPYKGMGMEGAVARWYARNTGRDRKRFETVARAICERTSAGSRILEVAPGPGYLAIELARSGRQVTALDISKSFVEMVKRNAASAGVSIEARHGNASAMPFDAASFDYVVCVAAFKNFTAPVAAIDEMHRVLRTGGQASIIDLRKEADWKAVQAEVEKMRLSWINRAMTSLTFRYLLLPRAYTSEQILRKASQSRFGTCEIETGGVGFEARFTKA